MIIVVEGRDGVGKTTLAQRLARERRDVQYYKTTNHPNHNDEVDDWLVRSVLLATGPVERTIVFDRGVISGIAYNPESRALDVDQAAVRAWTWFWGLLKDGHDVRLVHLVATERVREQRDPDGDGIVYHDLDAIALRTGQLLGHQRYYRWNTGKHGIEKVVNGIAEKLGLESRSGA